MTTFVNLMPHAINIVGEQTTTIPIGIETMNTPQQQYEPLPDVCPPYAAINAAISALIDVVIRTAPANDRFPEVQEALMRLKNMVNRIHLEDKARDFFERENMKELEDTVTNIIGNNKYHPDGDGNFTVPIETIVSSNFGYSAHEVLYQFDISHEEDDEFLHEKLDKVAEAYADYLNKNTDLPGRFFYDFWEADGYALLYVWEVSA